jgi:hypothetical protein
MMRDDIVIKKTWYALKYQQRRGLCRFQLCKLQYWASKITYRHLVENAVSYIQLKLTKNVGFLQPTVHT